MPYTVLALPEAEDELFRLWMEAADRDAVTAASNQIDILLKYEPLTRGQDYDDCRILAVGPLSAVYSVSLDDRKVTILQYILEG